MNQVGIDTLRQVQQIIARKPAQFDMEASTLPYDAPNVYENGAEREIECGITHCIGGWCAAILRKTFWGCLDVMGLSELEWDRLCHVDSEDSRGWPEEFRSPGYAWKPSIKQAIARIDKFIETDGAV